MLYLKLCSLAKYEGHKIMKLTEQTVIVGGFPNPIGGVTTFLSRLVKAYPQFVVFVLDLYADDTKRIPANYKGIYKLIPNKIKALIYLLSLQTRYKKETFFFNFSSGNSLIYFLLLPKLGRNWTLMLHHGHLTSRLPHFILKYILNKFNKIYTLNNRQTDFYKSICPNLPLITETSYVPATLIDISAAEKIPLIIAKKKNFKIVIGSGFPRKLYQHHLLIDLIEKNSNTFLFLFLYGEGELKQKLTNLNHPRIHVFTNQNEDMLNYYLSEANIYVRPTLEDSFGIVCADAINFGITAIASNVCTRYAGVKTFNLNHKEELYELFKQSL